MDRRYGTCWPIAIDGDVLGRMRAALAAVPSNIRASDWRLVFKVSGNAAAQLASAVDQTRGILIPAGAPPSKLAEFCGVPVEFLE